MQTTSPSPDLKSRARVMIGLVVLLVLVGAIMALQSKMLQVLVVVSESMEPTLKIGDRILIDANGFPERFNVVTLHDPNLPEKPEEQLVKRIVGVEGDVVEIRNGILFVNGEEQYSKHVTSNVVGWRDVRVRVPEGHIFVLGDNRNNSYDSLNFGPVSLVEVTGVLRFIIWPPQRWGTIPEFRS